MISNFIKSIMEEDIKNGNMMRLSQDSRQNQTPIFISVMQEPLSQILNLQNVLMVKQY